MDQVVHLGPELAPYRIFGVVFRKVLEECYFSASFFILLSLFEKLLISLLIICVLLVLLLIKIDVP